MTPTIGTAKAPCELKNSELNSSPFGLGCLRAAGRVAADTTQDSLSAAGQAIQVGFTTGWVPTKGFNVVRFPSLAPFPSLDWCNPINSLNRRVKSECKITTELRTPIPPSTSCKLRLLGRSLVDLACWRFLYPAIQRFLSG